MENAFEITILDKPGDVYRPGDVIEGHVTVNLASPLKIRGIYVTFQGDGHVQWSETRRTGTSKRRRIETNSYSATESYFDHKIPCFETRTSGLNEVNSELPELEAGNHIFPFRYKLPDKLPSSFKGSYGYVRYMVKAQLDIPGTSVRTIQKVFLVEFLLDLNEVPKAADRLLEYSHSRQVSSMCCKSGPVTAKVSLDRRGYVPGDSMVINAEINNGSHLHMYCTAARLFKFVEYKSAAKKRKKLQRVVASYRMPGMPAGETAYWRDVKIKIPQVPPSYLEHCNIIDMSYTLQFEVVPPKRTSCVIILFSVIIGSIPRREFAAQSGVTAQPQPLPSPFPPPKPSDLYLASQSIHEQSDFILPPPSYEECVDGDAETTMGDIEELTRVVL